jgi:hypothetical protein
MDQEHYNRLEQRRNWLNERIIAKQKVGWETVYDESERDALSWALDKLQKLLSYETPTVN